MSPLLLLQFVLMAAGSCCALFLSNPQLLLSPLQLGRLCCNFRFEVRHISGSLCCISLGLFHCGGGGRFCLLHTLGSTLFNQLLLSPECIEFCCLLGILLENAGVPAVVYTATQHKRRNAIRPIHPTTMK